jgi:hypothetical protein
MTPDPKPAKDNSEMGKRIAAQVRDTACPVRAIGHTTDDMHPENRG